MTRILLGRKHREYGEGEWTLVWKGRLGSSVDGFITQVTEQKMQSVGLEVLERLLSKKMTYSDLC